MSIFTPKISLFLTCQCRVWYVYIHDIKSLIYKKRKEKAYLPPSFPSPDKPVSEAQGHVWNRIWRKSCDVSACVCVFAQLDEVPIGKTSRRLFAYITASPSTFTLYIHSIYSRIFQNNNIKKKKKEDCSNTELSVRVSQVTPAALAQFLHLGSKAGNKKISTNSILRILATHKTGELKIILCWKQNWWKTILFACHSPPSYLTASR